MHEPQVATAVDAHPEDVDRLHQIALRMSERGLPPPLIHRSIQATAEVMRELRAAEEDLDSPLRRPEVQQFIAEHAVAERATPEWLRNEHRREEREELHAHVTQLVRQAQVARGRHEVKKVRARLLRLDQREIRRVLGADGEQLCRQINSFLRASSSLF